MMLPTTLSAEEIEQALQRMRVYSMPEENQAQVAYRLGWLNALEAVREALLVPEPRRPWPTTPTIP